MGLRQAIGLTCVGCGESSGLRPRPACPACGAQAALDVRYDYEEVARNVDRASLERREPWLWRYRELLPIDELSEESPLQLGMTPVYGSLKLAEWIGIQGLWLKDEGRNPTGSLEDRISAVAVMLAEEAGRRVVATGAGGDAGISLAAVAASRARRSVVFLPRAAERLAADTAMASRFGATVVHVEGDRADAMRLAREASERWSWFPGHATENPLLAEAMKTVGLEIGEQLAERMPDWVVAADPDGLLLASIHKGLLEMQTLGVIKTVPRLLGVDTGPATALLRAWNGDGATGGGDEAGPPGTTRALEALRASQGAMIGLGGGQGHGAEPPSDQREADEAARLSARLAAIPAGPAGGAALAGLRRAISAGLLPATSTALVVIPDRASTWPEAGSEGALEAGSELSNLEEVLRGRGLVK